MPTDSGCSMSLSAYLHVDGGSRGNPGLAACGMDLVDEHDAILCQGGWFLGTQTNNYAEYSALIWGIENALSLGVTSLHVQADSELMVKQMNSVYKVKNVGLKRLHHLATILASEFDSFEISHVYRSSNKKADEMVNKAMDAHKAVGSYNIALDLSPKQPSLFCKETASSNADATTSNKKQSHDATATVGQNEDRTILKNPASEASFDGCEHEDVCGTYELTVKDHFDAAHALIGYPGKCQYLHGHTWEIELTLAGTKLDSIGMLYDFKDIKPQLHALLDAFDHHCINDVAPFDRINPTAENLSRILYANLTDTLPEGIVLKEVAVWESPIAKVVFRPAE